MTIEQEKKKEKAINKDEKDAILKNMDNQEEIVKLFKDYNEFTNNTDVSYFFGHFIHDFEDEFCSFKYKQKVMVLSDSNNVIDIDAEDILQFNKYLYEYFINEPDVCLKHIMEAIADECLTLQRPIDKENILIKIRMKDVIPIADLRSEKVGNYIHLTGEVMGITQIFSRYTHLTFQCPICQTQMEIEQIFSKNIVPPYKCANPSCNNKKGFVAIMKDSQRINIQYGYLRESSQKALKNMNTIKFIVYQKDCGVQAGDLIDLFGVYEEEMIQNRSGVRNQATYFLDTRVIDKTGEVPFQEVLSTDYSRVYLNEKGVFLDVVTEDSAKTESLFSWDKLEVFNRYKIKEGTSFTFKYNGTISIGSSQGNTHVDFSNANIEEIKQLLLRNCSVSTKNMNLITIPLQKYLASFKDQSDELTKVIGFTEKGWKLPFNSIYLIEDSTGEEIQNNLKKIFQDMFKSNYSIKIDTDTNNVNNLITDLDKTKNDLLNATLEEMKNQFRNIYNLTGLKYKEHLFQWVLASPFSYVFRKYAGIMPALALHGIGEVGKTQFFEMAFCKLFGHIDNIISANTLHSDSRFEGLLASSTFPICFDEVTNAHKSMIDELKTHLTMDAQMIRRGGGLSKQFNTIEKVKCTPFTLTCNDPPEWFDDPYFLQRTIVFMINELKRNAGWNEAKNNCSKGLLTILIYQFTKDWTYKELRDYIKTIPIPANLEQKKDARPKSIYQFFGLGQKLLKDIFNIDTDLSEIENLIDTTRNISFDTFQALIEYQIDKGRIKYEVGSGNYKFQSDNWVKSPIFDGMFETENKIKIDCWGFTINNIRELQEKLEGVIAHKWTLNSFANKIISMYPNIQYGRFCLRKINDSDNSQLVNKQERCILIPKSYFDSDLQKIKEILPQGAGNNGISSVDSTLTLPKPRPNNDNQVFENSVKIKNATFKIYDMIKANCNQEDIINTIEFDFKLTKTKIQEICENIMEEMKKKKV